MMIEMKIANSLLSRHIPVFSLWLAFTVILDLRSLFSIISVHIDQRRSVFMTDGCYSTCICIPMVDCSK
jgi:hypothetical protein